MNILRCEFIGEALQIKKILFFILLMPAILFSQNISDIEKEVSVKALRQMSDKEINDYWIQAQERGYSLDQIKTLARAQGASESDLAEFERRIKKIGEPVSDDEDDNLLKTQNELTSIFGLKVREEPEKEINS